MYVNYPHTSTTQYARQKENDDNIVFFFFLFRSRVKIMLNNDELNVCIWNEPNRWLLIIYKAIHIKYIEIFVTFSLESRYFVVLLLMLAVCLVVY